MKFFVLLLSSFLLLQYQTQAQERITGTIDEWNEGEAKIMFMDMFSGYTRELGDIDAEGNFEIPLQENFLTSVKEAMEEEQKKASENRAISLKDLQGTYSFLVMLVTSSTRTQEQNCLPCHNTSWRCL